MGTAAVAGAIATSNAAHPIVP